jgi:release factor glutamine methyltransferase
MCEVLQVPRGRLDLGQNLSVREGRKFSDLVTTRSKRVPLQHITGLAPFRRIELAVGEGVFVPRPETELPVEAALRHLKNASASSERVRAFDLGAGSGAIAISLAVECERLDVVAVEKSSEAMAWLEKNLARHAERIEKAGSSVVVKNADFTLPISDWAPTDVRDVDVVIANPPYVPDHAQPRDLEVANFDPAIALFGGVDGLDAVKCVISAGADLLKTGGLLVIEHGDEQGVGAGTGGVPHWVKEHGAFKEINDRLDLNARPRFTTAIRA